MQYYFTDFYYWEQVLINKLRENGLYVYHIRDGNGTCITIEKRVLINRIGFLVTDQELPLQDDCLTGVEFSRLGGIESIELQEKIDAIKLECADEIAKAKESYERIVDDAYFQTLAKENNNE